MDRLAEYFGVENLTTRIIAFILGVILVYLGAKGFYKLIKGDKK